MKYKTNSNIVKKEKVGDKSPELLLLEKMMQTFTS